MAGLRYGGRPLYYLVISGYLLVIIRNTCLSVSRIASRPIEVRLAIVRSTSSQTMPSDDVTQRLFIASSALIIAVLTPLAIFMAQDGFAPSQSMPVRLAIIFFTAEHTCMNCPPIRYTRPDDAPVDATTHPHRADRRPRLCFM